MSVVSLQESFDVSLTQLITVRDALLQQKAIELATFGEQFTARVVSVAFGLKISGETIEMRSEQSATEINESAFFFAAEISLFDIILRAIQYGCALYIGQMKDEYYPC